MDFEGLNPKNKYNIIKYVLRTNNFNKIFQLSFTHKECPVCHKFSKESIFDYATHVYNIEGE